MKTLLSLEDLEIGTILSDGENEYKVLNIGGAMVWISQPNEFEHGKGRYTVQGLIELGINSVLD